ncbi:MAG TPA: NAD-dependent succinate-semialdehyde dehydrogenase [Polyangia bacterium]|nr:NAD-dependent succinate-semialdehyde dehydrogenase [Polyangia bacterium]
MPIASIDPTSGKTWQTFEALSDGALDEKLARASRVFAPWSRAPLAQRTAVLARAAEIFDAEATALGRLAAEEMGKLLVAGKQEAEKCATGCRYYVEHAEEFLRPEVVVDAEGERGEVHFDPIGPLLAIMPWNFPYWQVVRVASPALAAGNVVLLKHASSVPRCALALEDVFRRAGAPEGVFQTLLVGADRVEGIVADGRVAAVSLTGSEDAGRRVAAVAGKHLKKIVLELGGSDPFLVLASADVARAAATAVKARVVNNGQSCIAAKRFIAVDAVYEEFARRFADGMAALKLGDPLDAATELGPLSSLGQRDTLADQVARSVAAGARVLTGGHALERPGAFYTPTVLADIPPGSPAHDEELFGPVASLFRARDTETALAIANGSRFGLGASVWTRDRDEATRCARALETGSVFINDMVASDARFPFGGVKASGHGRELGRFGMRELVNVKTVRAFGL